MVLGDIVGPPPIWIWRHCQSFNRENHARSQEGTSGPEWAKEQQIPYPTFCYWRSKLADLTSKSFVELVDASGTHQELQLEWQGITVRLSKDFNERALKRFLQVLQELQC